MRPSPARADALALLLPLALLLALATQAGAQEPAPPPPPRPRVDQKIEPERMPGEASQAEQEIRELFGKVETRLREIDRLLSDASAGDVGALKQVGPSGLDQLLQRSREECHEAVREIDRILELARQLGSSQPSSMPGQGQPNPQAGSGNSPIDGQGSTSQSRERTPDAPPEQSGEGSQPQQGQGQPQDPADSQGQDPQGETPEDSRGGADPDPRTQRGAQPPKDGGTPGGEVPSDAERWGELPVHLRDLFRAEGGGSLPPRYRDFIDSYHRRLSRRP